MLDPQTLVLLQALGGEQGGISEDAIKKMEEGAYLKFIQELRSRFNRYALDNYIRSMQKIARLKNAGELDIDLLMKMAKEQEKASK